VNAAVRASKYHGIYPDDENLANVETRLRTILVGAFPRNKSWPDSMDPLPCARLSLGMLYLGQGQPVPALRSVLKGALFNTRKDDPEFVNDMMDVVTVLMVAGSLPADAPAFKDKSFPSVDDLRTVAYGYLLETAHKAAKAFGYDAEYAKGVIDMMSVMATKKPGSAPGSKEFMAEYEPAQRKLLAWAGVPEENGIVITNAQK
jgi:SET and MYND domain-containing protein